ncbi:MAG: TM0106 family RecB-like putative nuclease [Cyanophyceae cyanobacterium]
MLLTDELLLNHKRCQRRAYLDVHGHHQRDPQRDFVAKLRQESRRHSQKVLDTFYPHYQPLQAHRDWQARFQETEALMQQGVECIYRGVLLQPSSTQPPFQLASRADVALAGTPDLLIKQPGRSKFGDWQYLPISIRLGRRPKPEYKMIAAFHAQLLAAVQGVLPATAKIILRQLNDYAVNLGTWGPRMQEVLAQCLQSLQEFQEPDVFISRQRCSLCHWYSQCYAIASTEQHLSLVPGVTPARYQHLQSLGVHTLDSLANACSIYVGEVLGFQVASELKQQAESIVTEQAIRKPHRRHQSIPTASIELYFDIEAEPERKLDYLLGVLLVDRQANTQQFYPFLATTPEEEKTNWQQFLEFVSAYKSAPIFHYSEYEVEALRRLANLYNTPRKSVEQVISRFVDLHSCVVNSVVLPVESYSLKSLANWLGFQWRDVNASGEQSVCWYDRWLQEGDYALLEAILRYNEDDCRATYHLKDWLVNFLASSLPASVDSQPE